MPEYLAPGVYVEETSYRAKSIEGVSTSTAGFVGPTRCGPTSGKPEVLTSFADYQRTYGGLEDLGFGTNYMAHAARGFFDEGGARLYVMRVVGVNTARSTTSLHAVRLAARDVGKAGDMEVTFVLNVGGNILVTSVVGQATVLGLSRTRHLDSVVAVTSGGSSVRTARRSSSGTWTLVDSTSTLTLDQVDAVYPLTVSLDISRPTIDGRGLDTFTAPDTYGPMSLDPTSPDGLWNVFGPTSSSTEPPPLVLSVASGPPLVDSLTEAIAPTGSLRGPGAHWLDPASMIVPPTAPTAAPVHLAGGSDGDPPDQDDYEGHADDLTGLAAFAAIEDISMVAAPGSTAYRHEGRDIRQKLLIHCEAMRYRVAVLDVPFGKTVNDARDFRNETTSTRAAIYYPWVTVTDPFVGSDLQLPPSGFVAGIWARNDIRRAVFKAPANEVVLSARNLERRLTKGQQDVLNPDGVNCLRFFSGRGNLVWGARTISDDPEWKYVSVRRYFCYLEHSIERSTQWAVFESNGDALWANVRRTIEDFLLAEWKSGALLGTEPKDAFFVRCDRSTMTQADLDNGRLVCQIGVAVVKPAEFVIFRIGQWTATASN